MKMIQIDTKILPKIPGAFIVGGSIRDMLCGRRSADFDIAVVGDPVEFARQVENNTNGRLVEIGKPGQMIFRVVGKKNIIDISRAKAASIENDLKARDFTINAMAYDLSARRLIDPVGGQQDLKRKTIRMVSTGIFTQDPIRLLRAFRIAAAFQFTIGTQTLTSIKTHAALIRQSAKERVREEFFKMLQCTGSQSYLRQMVDTGLLFEILPELSALQQCRQNRHHQFNALEHTLNAYSHLEQLLDSDQKLVTVKSNPPTRKRGAEKSALLKFSILLHDIGKPRAQTQASDGTYHFYGHERRSAQMAESICKRIRCSKRDADIIYFLVRHHTRPRILFSALKEQNAAPRAVTRFFLKTAARISDLLIIAAADMLGKEKKPGDNSRAFIAFLNRLAVDFETDFKPRASSARLITGNDLIHKFNLKPSPLFKNILDRVEEEQLANSEMNGQEALALVRELIRNQSTTGDR